MANRGAVSMSIEKMQKLAEQLKTRPDIQVGVFTNGARKNRSVRTQKKGTRGTLTNADLATIHELGAPSVGIPPRSMLAGPIHDHTKEIMEPIRGKADDLLKTSGALGLWKLVGIACEKVVLGAFSTGGYGKWAPLKRSTLLAKLKGSLSKRRGQIAQIYAGQTGMEILIDTGQLRRAFSSRVRMGF
jgi:hypothetical protein